jgi:hypothetical protein
MYQQSTRSWSGYYCQDVVQLTSKSDISQRQTFKKYQQFEGREALNKAIDIYIEDGFFHTLKVYETIMIDVKIIDYFGRKMAQLTLEKINS